MKTAVGYDFPTVGCYIDESAGSADDCNLRTIRFAQAYGYDWQFEESGLSEADEEYSQWLSDTADSAVSFLNDLETRSYMYWTFEDNSLFLMADVEQAREDAGNGCTSRIMATRLCMSGETTGKTRKSGRWFDCFGSVPALAGVDPEQSARE